MKNITKKILLRCGVGAHLSGFTYLGEAVEMTVEDETKKKAITKSVYFDIAKKHNVSWNSVERCIRHAIERSFDFMTPDQNYAIYRNSIDYRKGKPTNSQFIATVIELFGDEIRCGE